MPSTGVQAASFDAETTSAYATKNLGTKSSIKLQSSGPGRRGFFYFALPATLPGDTIISATFNLYQKGSATGGSRQLTVQRVDAQWTASKITHTNKPDGTGATATVTQGNSSVDGRVWSFVVEPLITQVATGGAIWYGFRVESNNATAMAVYAAESSVFRPTLEIVYESVPEAPSNLRPSAGNAVSIARPTLQWASVLADSISHYYVQVDDNSDFSSPLIDTGWVDSTLPEYALTADLSIGTTYYWRVKVRAPGGAESVYSATESFTRTAKPTLTIDNPAVAPNNFVNESTPPFAWTVTGGTQTKYQVQVWDVSATPTEVYDSDPVDGAGAAHTPSSEVRFVAGRTYRLDVTIWDDVARQATPGDPDYVKASREFTFVFDAATAPVDTIGPVVTNITPYVAIPVTRATAPDFFQVFNGDDEPMTGYIEPADVFVSGTSYTINVLTFAPNSTYNDVYVACITNGVTSDVNPTVDITTSQVEGIWLCAADGSNPICINSNDSIGSWTSGEVSAVHQPLGSKYAVVLWQNSSARNSDNISGYLVGNQEGLEDIDIEEWRARYAALTNPLGQKLVLSLTDSSIPVYIRKPVQQPATEEGDVYVQFEAYERPPD